MKLSSIASFCVVVCILSGFASCNEASPQSEASPTNESVYGTLTASEVKQRYQVMCELCHGDDGKKAYAGAKDLSLSTLTLAERVAIIKYGKGQMTPFESRLSDEEIKALAEYIEQLK